MPVDNLNFPVNNFRLNFVAIGLELSRSRQFQLFTNSELIVVKIKTCFGKMPVRMVRTCRKQNVS